MKKMRLPERAATGDSNSRGPSVRRVGLEVERPRSSQRSLLPPLEDWKTKARPSAVQTPQHSAAGWLKSARMRWGVRSEGVICQRERVWEMGSRMVKRRSLPLGSQRSQKARPGRVA